MKYTLSDKLIAYLALFSGLTISAVAIWYSVAGLVSIFAAAVVPIIVMGVVLEISKLIATVWLKLNWNRAPKFIRTYLLIAIAVLMVITSMGIFGFLSKAHSDQSLVSGDVQAKIAVYDEKIKTAKENIDANRRALKQMDEAVDQVMGRSADEKGAEKAVAIRRGQTKERTRLLSDIAAEQKTITKLSEERAPIAAEVRKVEAEVGPIKYIAAFVYGDNPDANVLEKAVTWVIIIIVSVFDPLAVILLLASQYSFQWFRKAREEEEAEADLEEVNEWFAAGKERARQLDVDAANAALYKSETDDDLIEKINAELAEVIEQDRELNLAEWEAEKENALPEVEVEEVDTTIDQWNKMVEEAEKAAEEEKENEDHKILNEATSAEAEAMRLWKQDHPNSSLKQQRKLLERGIIQQLPWDTYFVAQPDISETDAAAEALKWAQEQMDRPGDYLTPPDEESKKKDNDLDGDRGQTTDQEVQGRIKGYIQNAEQNEKTLWQRVQDAKK